MAGPKGGRKKIPYLVSSSLVAMGNGDSSGWFGGRSMDQMPHQSCIMWGRDLDLLTFARCLANFMQPKQAGAACGKKVAQLEDPGIGNSTTSHLRTP